MMSQQRIAKAKELGITKLYTVKRAEEVITEDTVFETLKSLKEKYELSNDTVVVVICDSHSTILVG